MYVVTTTVRHDTISAPLWQSAITSACLEEGAVGEAIHFEIGCILIVRELKGVA